MPVGLCARSRVCSRTAKRSPCAVNARATLLRENHGAGGFGYDPLFYVEKYGCTFGELPAEVKNTISHRANALNKLKAILKIK